MPRAMAAPTKSHETTVTLRFARVAFTGRLASMSRREADLVVRDARGVPVSGVSRRTSIVVVGMDGWPLLPDATVSRKLQRAEAINREGGRIRIVSEDDFLEIAGLQERRPRLRKSYPASHVCELLGLEEVKLRSFELLGLIRAEDGLYDFQDIVSLRTIAELIGRGADPAAIGRSIRGLASVLPGTDRPLAQLKLITDGPTTLLAEIGQLRLAPDGQLMLNFSPAPSAEGEAIRADFADDADAFSAGEWLDYGRSCEDEERLEEADRAYRRALSLRPHFPEAQFNLGNVLRELGNVDDAEQCFRTAVEHDPTMAVGWYNLADLLEEHTRPDEVVECLRRALEIDPLYADAHFNVAGLLDGVGCAAEASEHWAAYLKLDPDSEWARVARSRVSEEPA